MRLLDFSITDSDEDQLGHLMRGKGQDEGRFQACESCELEVRSKARPSQNPYGIVGGANNQYNYLLTKVEFTR
jgi:hypothetical protein